MTQFTLARHGSNDWRLMMWDGTTEIEVNTWDTQPTLRQAMEALMDYHGTGNSPFSSREGTLDSLELVDSWQPPLRDLTRDGETFPWNDS